jgi:hypothetical protein
MRYIANMFVLAIFLFASVGNVSATCDKAFRPNLDFDYSNSHFEDQWNLCSEISDNYNYYDVLVISDSANFEACNQAVLVHFLKNGKLEILNTENMKTYYTTLKELSSKYELYFFITNPDKRVFMPEKFDNSGVLNSNFESTYEDWKSGVFTQSKINDFKEQQKKVEAAKRN